MPDLLGDIELGATGSEVRYPLERADDKLSYDAVTVNDQASLNAIADYLPVEASWPHGYVGGLGETFRISEDSTGYVFGYNVDTTGIGMTRVRGKKVTSAAFSANVTKVPTFMIEEDVSGTKYIFAFTGPFGLQGTTDGDAITVNGTEKTFVGTAPVCGRPAKFGGVWHIPLGGANADENIATLTNVANNTYADDPTTGDQASHFATRSRGAVQVMDFAGETSGTNAHKVGVTTDGTTYPSPGFEVGDSGADITNMGAAPGGTFIPKKNNLFRIVNGVSQQLTRFNEGDVDDDYGAGFLVPGGSDSCFYAHGGLYFFDGHNVRNISPNQNPAFVRYGSSVGGSTLVPDIDFTFFEGAYGSDTWTYWVAKVSSSTDTYILALRKDGDQFTWHNLWFQSADDCRGLIVDSGHRLWTVDVDNNKFLHVQLGQDNQPQASGTTTGESGMAASVEPLIVGPATDFGFPNVKKQFRSMEAYFWGCDAENTCGFKLATDGSTAADFGAVINSADGAFVQRKVSSATSGYTFAGGMEWADMDGTNDPRFRGLIMRAALLPNKAIKHTFTIDTRKPYAGGALKEWNGPTALTALRALERAAPTKFRDPGGTQDDALVNSVTVRETFVGTRTDYLIDVQVTSFEI